MKTTRRGLIIGGASVPLLAGAGFLSQRLGMDRGQIADIEAGDPWNGDGAISHLIPTASHDRFRLKLSVRQPAEEPPVLSVSGTRYRGTPSDSEGLFFNFDVSGLSPASSYLLELFDSNGREMCGSWPLRTLPNPEMVVERLRILTFTCAGGADFLRYLDLDPLFLPRTVRKRLLARGLDFEPDIVIANGDHIYWDMDTRPGLVMGRSPLARIHVGSFDQELSVLGTRNERVLKALARQQIIDVYGSLLRSTPSYFLQDDHDYFENDELIEGRPVFPASRFMRDAARTTQNLYYPEFVNVAGLPASEINNERLATHHGTIRYGTLAEILTFDCRNAISLGANAGMLDPAVEAWIVERNRVSPARFVINMPSIPILWTVGKWGEWYPDVADETGLIGTNMPKPAWEAGWEEQHNRLVLSSTVHSERPPVWISGDLHATAMGKITGLREADLSRSPVNSVLVGTLGTSSVLWASAYRGAAPQPSSVLRVEEILSPLEENGFSLIDIFPEEVRIAQFRWLPSDGVDAIARLMPFAQHTVARV